MAYGTIKVDTITFTDSGVDKSVSISGLVQNPTFSGNITVTGTVSGNTIQGQTVSGVTVTGTTANFTSGNFTTVTGGTITLTSGVIASGTAANPSLSILGDANTGLYSPGADQLAISTGGSGRLFVDASGVVTIPVKAVLGSTNSLGGFVEATRNTAGVFTAFRLLEGGTNPYLQTGAEAGIIYLNADGSSVPAYSIRTQGTEKLRITAAGLVGVGTSSPSATLELSTAGSASVGTFSTFIPSLADTSRNNIQFGKSSASNESAFIAYQYNASGTSNISIHHFGDSYGTALNVNKGGRVGIGTTNPATDLHVSNAAGGRIRVGGAAGAGIEFNGSDTKIDIPAANTLAFYANTNERLRITSTGTVNIVGAGTAGSTQAVSFNGSAPVNSLVLTSAGFVGIGTSPSELIHASKDQNTATIIRVDNINTGSSATAAINLKSGVKDVNIAAYGAGNSFLIQGFNGIVTQFQDFNTHIWRSASATEYARFDSSGRLLVGTSTSLSAGNWSDSLIQVRGNSSGSTFEGKLALFTGRTIAAGIGAGETLGRVAFGNGEGGEAAWITAQADAGWSSNDYPGRLVFSTTADGASSPTERMRIQSDGNILIGVTSGATGLLNVGPVANKTGIFGSASTAGSAGIQGAHTVNSATGYVAYFANSGSATGLYISNTAAWQSTSDERLKTDIQDLDAVSRLMQIKPRSYLWKSQATSDEPTKRNLGFIAQEVQEVFPELVGESPDGMLSVEYTGLIAPLVNTIQFLKAEIDALKAEVTALKAQ